METVVEALGLLKRQVALETAMAMRGGSCVAAEQEMRAIQARLATCSEAARATLAVAHARRCSVLELNATDVEKWALESAA